MKGETVAKRKQMRFRDIKKFIRSPDYKVHIPWGHLMRQIQKGQEELGLNLDPDFQRAHVWNDQKRIAYIEYVLRGGSGSKEILFNHPGWMTTFKGEYVLVDGKQRLEAITRFLNGSLPIFGRYYFSQFTDNIDSLDVEVVWCINNLQTRYEVLQWYLDINTGGVVHTDEEIARVQALLDEEEKANGYDR